MQRRDKTRSLGLDPADMKKFDKVWTMQIFVLKSHNPSNKAKDISLPALWGALRHVVHEHIPSRVISPVTCHAYNGAVYKTVTEKEANKNILMEKLLCNQKILPKSIFLLLDSWFPYLFQSSFHFLSLPQRSETQPSQTLMLYVGLPWSRQPLPV